ncbi:MAG: DUF308 domain-containing protein [Chitinophagales bacterium]|nr:DUF308 domain-containing protein [Chitinophagales bacterium]
MKAYFIDELEENRRWIMLLGIFLIILGIIALSFAMVATLVSVLFFGMILIIAGIVQGIYGFRPAETKSGLNFELIFGILSIIAGGLIATNFTATAFSMTIVLAAFLILGGIYRIIVATTNEFAGKSWILFSGILSLSLGILVFIKWPFSGLYVIGFGIGVDLMFFGSALIKISSAVKDVEHI